MLIPVGTMAALDTFDIYLVLRPFRGSVAPMRRLLSPLAALETRLAVGADGYYSPRLDTALVAVRFERKLADRLGPGRLRSMVRSVGLPIITPDHLPFERRCEFFLEHLAHYTTYVQQYVSDNESTSAIDRVVDALGQHVAGHQVPHVHNVRHERPETSLPH